MIHELREYKFKQQDWPKYRLLFEDYGMPVRRNDFGRLLGAWECDAEVGMVGFVHIWAYDSLHARAELRVRLGREKAWTDQFIVPARPLIQSQILSVLNPLGTTPELAEAVSRLGYLHRYRCAVGGAPALADHLKGLHNVCWTTEFSDPNEVACLTNEVDPLRAMNAEEANPVKKLSMRSFKLNPIKTRWL